jgi:hypothetical protein
VSECDGEKKDSFGTHENLLGHKKAMATKETKKAIKFEHLVQKIETVSFVMESAVGER